MMPPGVSRSRPPSSDRLRWLVRLGPRRVSVTVPRSESLRTFALERNEASDGCNNSTRRPGRRCCQCLAHPLAQRVPRSLRPELTTAGRGHDGLAARCAEPRQAASLATVPSGLHGASEPVPPLPLRLSAECIAATRTVGELTVHLRDRPRLGRSGDHIGLYVAVAIIAPTWTRPADRPPLFLYAGQRSSHDGSDAIHRAPVRRPDLRWCIERG